MYYISPGSAPGLRNDQTKIPLTKSVPNGTNGSFVLRGYQVPYTVANAQHHSISLCGDLGIFQQLLQFRWLQTSLQTNEGIQDVVRLDNLTIRLHEGFMRLPTPLFEDNFDLHTSPEYVFRNILLPGFNCLFLVYIHMRRKLPLLLLDNVHLLYNVSNVTNCQVPNSSDGGALFFYTEPTSISTSHESIISSRQVVLGPLDPQITTLKPISTNMPRRRDRARVKEEEALANIGRNKRLSRIRELVQK